METLDDFSFLMDINSISVADYQYFHQLFHNRTVVFNKEMDENVIEGIYLPLRDFENDTDERPVTLILNSPGGSVTDSFFLAHYLDTYKKKLDIIVTGYAASMALVVLCGGTNNPNITRYCYPSTYSLIHDGYITLNSNETKTASDIMDFNTRTDKKIKEFIISHSNITEEQYESKTRRQWFLDAQEMKELNLIDKIIGETI